MGTIALYVLAAIGALTLLALAISFALELTTQSIERKERGRRSS